MTKNPTHGAIPLPVLNQLMRYFQETPMAHNVSNPFLQALGQAQLITVENPPLEAVPDEAKKGN